MSTTPVSDEQRRRRVKRNAWLLLVLAAGFYFGFILLAVRAS